MSAFPSAAGLYLRFRSRIDAWLGGVILLRILIGAALAIGLLLQKGIASLAIAPLLAAGLSLWMLVETWYGIDDKELFVQCGPFRTSVPISNIRAIRPTRTGVSAPALSLDRLEVIHSTGTLVISPSDQVDFIRALKARNAAVEIEPFEDVRPLRGGQ